MPMQGIFADIQHYLQAREVGLPDNVDILHCRTEMGGVVPTSRPVLSIDSGYASRRTSPRDSVEDESDECTEPPSPMKRLGRWA